MEVISSPAMVSSTNASLPCDICTGQMQNIITGQACQGIITTPCKHKCCSNCYLKIDKCHMCRAPLPQVFKVDLQIYNYTVPFYFCRGDVNIDMHLNKTRNTYIIHNILAAHNLAGFMDCIQPEDITIDMNKIKIDRNLSLAVLMQDFDPLYKADDIISSYFNKDLVLPYIIQPSDEELEIESNKLFVNVISLIRLAIAYDSPEIDYIKPTI